MVVTQKFGRTLGGEEITLYSLKNAGGMQAGVTDFGAILVSLVVPDKKGEKADVVLGYDRAKDYLVNGSCFGATVGPIANRTENAVYELDGTIYNMVVNDGLNNLHTDGDRGLHKTMWQGEIKDAENAVTFTCTSRDGYLGLPGNRKFQVTYKLTEDNALEIHYYVETDKKTLVNMTNHSYFNLKGHDSEQNVEDVKVTLYASHYTKVRKGAIPTGEIADVTGTVFDFRTPRVIGKDIDADNAQLQLVDGYDHNFVIDGYEKGKLQKAAVVEDEKAGRCMEVYTDLPGVHLYTANNMEPELGKGDAYYFKRSALCLETQFFPNSANETNFIRPVVEPGEPFVSTTIYKFV